MDAWFYVVLVGVVAAALICIWAATLTVMDWIRDRHRAKLKESLVPVGRIERVWTDKDGIHADIKIARTPAEERFALAHPGLTSLKPGVKYILGGHPMHEGINYPGSERPTDLLPDN